MDAQEQIDKFQEFFESNYYEVLLDKASKNEEFLVIEFQDLAKFDIDLAEMLLEQPEDTIKAAEYAISRFDLGVDEFTINVRFASLPASSEYKIRNIRSKHLDKFFQFSGIVRQKSDVRPQVTNAKFECPSCGNIINILQVDVKFREPSGCSCGRKGKFHLVNKDLVDAQKLVIEESPEDLEGGEQPKRINVFLKNDLVSPMSEKKTNPGSKINITGTLKEVPIILVTGGKSTRYDLMIEANYLEAVQEEFTSLTITPEEKEVLMTLSKDPDIYEKLITSIAPSIYGHERIKEALMLQLLGGEMKTHKDGVRRRGDIHVLLIGDPGSGKSQLLKRISIVAPKARFVSGKGSSGAGLCVSPESIVLTNPGGMTKIKDVVESRMNEPENYTDGIWRQQEISDVKIQSLSRSLKIQSKNPESIWKLKAPKNVYEVILRSGKKIEITGNTKLLSVKQGSLKWIKSMKLVKGDYIGTPRKLIAGEIKERQVIDLIKSNPVVHNVKPIVMKITEKLRSKYGTLRAAATKLEIREDQLYYNWVNEKARGNIKLKQFKTLCQEVGEDYSKFVKEVSLYNGKKHALPRYISEEFLYVAGLIAGDGDVRSSGSTFSIRFSNSNNYLHKIFQNTINHEFNISFDIQKGSEIRPKATRFHSKLLAEILFSLGMLVSPKSNKIAMSNELLRLSNKLVGEFVAGLFDSDGCINARKTRGGDSIELYSCSEKLIRQIQLVLLRYEIHSRIRKREPTEGKIKGKYPRWCLEIRGQNEFQKFAKQIKIKHPIKTKKLKILIKKRSVSNSNIDVIPGISEPLKNVIKYEKKSLKKIGWTPTVSRMKAQKILNSIPDNNKHKNLRELANSDIFWDSVKKITKKKTPYEYVYDLTVEDSHNFVVDGILVHNTAAVVRDEFLRGWALEAGALVLANKGIVCIDELDKMTKEDTSAMHEALEQQQVSISKANIQATLRAETTVLAAANPKFGRFDPYDLLVKQIDLPSTLINRFDLIFPVKDLPNLEKDEKLASFILNLHKGDKEIEVPIESEILTKYIGYAKQSTHPVLTEAALNEIKSYFVSMRNSGGGDEKIQTIPISARQLEGLIRLSEASAKTRFSNKISKKDAQRAIDLMHHCLSLIGLDIETGKFDIDRIATGISASQRGNISRVKEIIAELERAVGKQIPMDDLLREAEIKGIPEDATSEVVEKLKRAGDLFSPKPGFVSRI